ncbi:MAG: hypothetical protein O6913_04235 [Chloroflexi bacterium]|nr:hypothetical protein [Chloroflexota bacterium]MCZ6708558.1 hypothetical protein [Chloroflexota bacterium]
MRRSLALLGLLATLALLLAACGGDDTLSDREYFAALEAVSADAEARDAAIPEPSPDDPESVPAFFELFQALFVGVRADLAAIAAPTELAAAHDAFVEAIDAVIDNLERVRGAGADETIVDVLAFFEANDAFGEFNRACATLQQLAADRNIDFVFDCTDE